MTSSSTNEIIAMAVSTNYQCVHISRGEISHTLTFKTYSSIHECLIPLVLLALRNFVINRARIFGAYLIFFQSRSNAFERNDPYATKQFEVEF